jgi:hypothetical protein
VDENNGRQRKIINRWRRAYSKANKENKENEESQIQSSGDDGRSGIDNSISEAQTRQGRTAWDGLSEITSSKDQQHISIKPAAD